MTNSTLGEISVVREFLKLGYDVFTGISGKENYDMIIVINDKPLKVEVKSTSRRTPANTGWEVQVKRTRSNRSTNKIIPFNENTCDILAVYIQPIDKVIILDRNNIRVKSVLTIKDDKESDFSDG